MAKTRKTILFNHNENEKLFRFHVSGSRICFLGFEKAGVFAFKVLEPREWMWKVVWAWRRSLLIKTRTWHFAQRLWKSFKTEERVLSCFCQNKRIFYSWYIYESFMKIYVASQTIKNNSKTHQLWNLSLGSGCWSWPWPSSPLYWQRLLQRLARAISPADVDDERIVPVNNVQLRSIV